MKQYAIIELDLNEIVNKYEIYNSYEIFDTLLIKYLVERILAIDCYAYRTETVIIEFYEYIETSFNNPETFDFVYNVDVVTLIIDLLAQFLDETLRHKLKEDYPEYVFFKWLNDRSIILEKQ